MMSSVAWGRKSETGTFLRFAKSGVAVCIIGCALTVPARAATKVAVIDGGSPVPPTEGQHWCGFLNDNGYECTLFPRSGPTETLDPFQVIIDMSDEWSDPTGSLADQMRARKGVITWGSAPGALGLSSNPWIGANDNVNSCDDLVTLVRDPILGSIPPGIAVAFCGDGPCWSLLDTIGHPDAKILATFPSYCYGIGILRNTWEGGQSVYLFGHITPGNAPPLHDDIILSTMRTLSRPIPATSLWTLLTMAGALLAAGVAIAARRRGQLSSALSAPHTESSVRRTLRTILYIAIYASVAGVPRLFAQTPSGDVVEVVTSGSGTTLSLPGLEPFHSTEQEVRDLRTVAIPGSPGQVILWDEAATDGTTTPYYAITLDGQEVARVTDTSYAIALRYASFDPIRSYPSVPAPLVASEGAMLYLVQFVSQPLPQFLAQLNEMGAAARGFVANHAEIVEMNSATAAQVALLPYVRFVGPFHPLYRIAPELIPALLSDPDSLSNRAYSIMLVGRGANAQSELLACLEDAGITGFAMSGEGHRVEARASAH